MDWGWCTSASRALVTWVVLSAPLCAAAQLDYRTVHERLPLSCGIPDSTTLVGIQRVIDSVSTAGVVHGREDFLRDRALVYYFRYVKWKASADLMSSIADSEVCWSEFGNTSCLWDLGTKWRAAGDCTKALDATELYVRSTDPDLINYHQVYLRFKFCRGKE